MAPVFEDTTEPVVMAPPIRFSPSVENYNPAPAPAVCENSACEPITMRIEGPQVFASAPEPMRIDAVALAAAEQPIPPPAPPVDGSSAGAPSGSPGSFAQVEKLGDAPKSTTLEFLRTQAVLLNPGQCQFDWGLTYSVLDTRFTLPVVDGNGNVVNTANARERLRLLTIPLAVRYGIANGVQGYLNLPVGWSNTELTTDFGDSITNNFGGLGDMSGGLSYHLCKACGPYIPDIIGTLGFVAPTGHASFATSLLTPSSTLGQGFWQLTGNLLFVHTMDPLVLYYGGGYVHRFNASFGPNDVDPGEELDYLMGVGFAVNPFVTISGSLIGGYITTYKVNDTFIPGSDRDPMRFRVSVTVVKGEHICEPFGEIGMTPDSPSRVGVVFTY